MTPPNLSTTATLDDVDASVGLVDGRVAMSADVEGTLRIQTPEHTPLSTSEPHLTLRVATDDVRVEITLDGADLDGLADAIYQAREGSDD
jgi:hypothetical protein